MKTATVRQCIFFVLAYSAFVWAQHANDTLLFTIKLTDDTTDLFGCRWGEPVRNSLSGPVLMENHNLLFYSRDGYVLYDQRGKIVDSYSLIRKNRMLSRRGRSVTRLAYPLDKSILVFYKESMQQYDSEIREVFHKRLSSNVMKSVGNNAENENNRTFGSSRLFNLYHNSCTDEMSFKSFLEPHLVGYSSLDGGRRWWSLDKFYSFTSPLILEESGKYLSFFPGFRGDDKLEVKKKLVEPLGVFWMNGQWYYYGVYSPDGAAQEQYLQQLYLCDQAGNLLYDNSIQKMTMVDDVLGESEEDKLLYTVRRASRHAFLPAIDENGDIYYGVIDYKKKRIEVIKRLFYHFIPQKGSPALEQKMFDEQGYEYDLSSKQCGAAGGSKPYLPKIRYTESGGKVRQLTADDLTKDGYLIKIARRRDDNLHKTVSRIQPSLPPRVRQIQDSLAKLSTAWCPYSLELTHEVNGRLCSFNYGLGEVVVSARVVSVVPNVEVFVRVDLVDWAEIVVLSADGRFLNRFKFNSENYEIRNDIVAIADERQVIEKDYEVGEGAHRFVVWTLATMNE